MKLKLELNRAFCTHTHTQGMPQHSLSQSISVPMRRGAQARPGKAYYGIAPGRWTSNDIIMDDVECGGTETAGQQL